MLTTPHGRDALAFEAARLQAAAWLEDGGSEDQKLAASAARCFDAGSDGIVDGRDLPRTHKIRDGRLERGGPRLDVRAAGRLGGDGRRRDVFVSAEGPGPRAHDRRDHGAHRARGTRARDRHRAHDVTDDLRRARRNALDHLVENACLRAHACRDAEHKIRILSSTRRGLARLEWDACNHEAMRDHYFARATSLSKEDAALEEAAYVFAWFDVEHSGVLDTHEACPKFMLAFGCCATWPEALVATRDAAPGKADVVARAQEVSGRAPPGAIITRVARRQAGLGVRSGRAARGAERGGGAPRGARRAKRVNEGLGGPQAAPGGARRENQGLCGAPARTNATRAPREARQTRASSRSPRRAMQKDNTVDRAELSRVVLPWIKDRCTLRRARPRCTRPSR